MFQCANLISFLFFPETPKAANLHVTQTTASSLTIRWRVSDDGQSPINRVSVNYKMTYGEWVSEDLGKIEIFVFLNHVYLKEKKFFKNTTLNCQNWDRNT